MFCPVRAGQFDMIYFWPRLDLFYTDPAQHTIMTDIYISELDYLRRDLSNAWNISTFAKKAHAMTRRGTQYSSSRGSLTSAGCRYSAK